MLSSCGESVEGTTFAGVVTAAIIFPQAGGLPGAGTGSRRVSGDAVVKPGFVLVALRHAAEETAEKFDKFSFHRCSLGLPSLLSIANLNFFKPSARVPYFQVHLRYTPARRRAIAQEHLLQLGILGPGRGGFGRVVAPFP